MSMREAQSLETAEALEDIAKAIRERARAEERKNIKEGVIKQSYEG